jgi:hypothetical protein
MAKRSGAERIEHMVNVLREWQGIERQSINDMAETIEETENPLIRLVMEIIRSDSLMHHRVQQFLIDSVTRKDVTLTREDVAKVWEKIEEHDKHEKQTIKLAEELRAEAWSPVHKQFLDYLLTDERKHEELLSQLEDVKQGMSRSSGG